MDERQALEIVEAALAAGVTLFDTADVYNDGESERLLGAALAARRDEVVIATKFGRARTGVAQERGASRSQILRSVDASLRRLRTDYIDLYQLHAPDPSTPPCETLSTLDDIVRAGKVRYIGSSNMQGWQVADADWVARRDRRERYVCAQVVYNLLERGAERELFPSCRHFGVGIIAALGLARGALTGKHDPGIDPPPAVARYLHGANGDVLGHLRAWADSEGRSLAEVALGTVASQPEVAAVLAGATSAEQVRANARAIAWVPSASERRELDAISAGCRALF